MSTKSDALVRMMNTAFRRYSREPDTRISSARHMLSCALAIYAEHGDLGATALHTAEVLAELKRQEREDERATG
jgi:hypothetical protein